MSRPKSPPSSEEAEVLAIQALGFLATDAERLQRFLDLSGLTPEAIRQNAANPGFLGSILDYLLADETLLLIFAEENGLKPERVAHLRRKLPGAPVDF
jgi:hypothetical protein